MNMMTKLLISMMIPFVVFGLWDKYPIIKDSVHFVLDPTFGVLLNMNLWVGFLIIIAVISFLQTLAQKYLTNQAELKKLKHEQKLLQEEMKKYENHPEKLMELQKKSFEFVPKTMDLTMGSVIYTSIPFILLFRWFTLYLMPIWGNWWILYYLIGSMVFSSIFRKWLDVA
jgi:uncharacterized membrane protein (DUF106 family)